MDQRPDIQRHARRLRGGGAIGSSGRGLPEHETAPGGSRQAPAATRNDSRLRVGAIRAHNRRAQSGRRFVHPWLDRLPQDVPVRHLRRDHEPPIHGAARFRVAAGQWHVQRREDLALRKIHREFWPPESHRAAAARVFPRADGMDGHGCGMADQWRADHVLAHLWRGRLRCSSGSQGVGLARVWGFGVGCSGGCGRTRGQAARGERGGSADSRNRDAGSGRCEGGERGRGRVRFGPKCIHDAPH